MAGRGVRRVVIDKIQLLMAVVTVAALVASAMGIASLMTSTIMERAKEIGLMKALGARQWQIMLLFYGSGVQRAGWRCAGMYCRVGLAKAIGVMLFDAPLNFALDCGAVRTGDCGTDCVDRHWFPARRIARLYPVEVLYGR